MFKIDEYLMYKRDVCKVIEINEKYINDRDYYLISPISDASLTIKIPTDNKCIKKLLSIDELNDLIKKIPSIPIIETNNRLIETQYKELLHSDNHESLIKIIKTTYCRNEKRFNNNKKISDIDDHYFKLAEKYLYNEFSIVLNISYDKVKEYIINTINNS